MIWKHEDLLTWILGYPIFRQTQRGRKLGIPPKIDGNGLWMDYGISDKNVDLARNTDLWIVDQNITRKSAIWEAEVRDFHKRSMGHDGTWWDMIGHDGTFVSFEGLDEAGWFFPIQDSPPEPFWGLWDGSISPTSLKVGYPMKSFAAAFPAWPLRPWLENPIDGRWCFWLSMV